MFDNILNFFKKILKKESQTSNSKDTAKERLHLVLLQDRANVSADFLDLMKQEIIEVIKKYIEIDEGAIDVRLTNKENSDGTNGAPALYANIPIVNIKDETRKIANKEENKVEEVKIEEVVQEDIKENKEEDQKIENESKEDVDKIEEDIKQEEQKNEEESESEENDSQEIKE